MEPRCPLLAIYVIFIKLNTEILYLKTGNHQSVYNALKKSSLSKLPPELRNKPNTKVSAKKYNRIMSYFILFLILPLE